MANATDYLEVEIRKGIFRTSPVLTRVNTTAYVVGDRVMLGTGDLNVYEVTTAGTTAAAPPTFNLNIGDSTTDGTVVFLTLKQGLPKRPLYVALFTVTPSDSAAGTEVTGGAYARVPVQPLDANWTAASPTDGLTDNAAAITFLAPTANWGVIVASAIMDRLTGGNMLVWAPVTPNKTVNNGDPAPAFAIGAYDVTIA